MSNIRQKQQDTDSRGILTKEIITDTIQKKTSYPQEALLEITKKILKEVDFDKQFDFIEFAFSLKEVQRVQFDTNDVGILVRLCEKVLQLAVLYKQKQINLNPNNKYVREKLRDILNIDLLYQQLFISDCYQCVNQESLSQFCKRIRAIIQLLLDYSEDVMLFYYVFEALNRNTPKNDQEQNFKLIKKLIDSIEKQENIFYWHTLFDIILEISMYDEIQNQLLEPNLVVFIIINEIHPDHIQSIMSTYIGQYLIKIKPFQSKKQALSILKSLISYGMNKSNLKLILCICEQLKYQQSLEVLNYIHQQFACKELINNLYHCEVFDEILYLISFFFIGLQQQTQQKFIDDALIIIVNKLSLRLKYSDYSEKEKIYVFLNQMRRCYKDIPKIDQFQNIFNKLQKDFQLTIQNSDSKLQDSNWSQNPQECSVKKQKNKLIGIRNINNTCYFNSFIQGIFMTTEFREIILSIQIPKDQNLQSYLSKSESGEFLVQLKKVFSFLEFVNEDVDLCPIAFKQSLREPYRSQYSQQDAGEFGTQFFEDLEAKMGLEFGKVKKLFIGQIKYLFHCKQCGQTIQGQKEDFLQLTLNFPQTEGFSYNYGYSSSQRIKIKDLLERHMQPEMIDMTCDQCHKQSKCQKSLTFEYLPKCLIIMLNRFQFNRGVKTKILTTVNLDFTIQITGEQNSTYIYELYAFIVHQGENADAGHYITYAKDYTTDQWILFDDSDACVQKNLCTENDLLAKCLYFDIYIQKVTLQHHIFYFTNRSDRIDFVS